MRLVAQVALLLVALLGHVALWTGLVNRIHSTGMPRWTVKWLSLFCLAAVLFIPAALATLALLDHDAGLAASIDSVLFLNAFWRYGVYYLVPCMAIAVIVAIAWIRRQFSASPPPALRRLTAERFDISRTLGKLPASGWFTRILSRVPGNQVFWLSVEHREIEFARLPSSLDGFSIVHLSDFHFTGRIRPEYYQEVVQRANALQPDLIAVTGDLVDHAHCFAWLPETLGRLRAKAGVFYILGNHDLRTRDVPRLRGLLKELGLVDVGGRWVEVKVGGESLLLAGNELPWIAPAADMRACIAAAIGIERDRPFRILLAHSPDQFRWAQRWDFDLVLAGHTHGGQFCLPGIGPFLTPSWHGVQYASGTFAASQTVMHVSRGTSSELPLRWNCPPELGRIVLRTARGQASELGGAN